jgi:hypothetical protein
MLPIEVGIFDCSAEKAEKSRARYEMATTSRIAFKQAAQKSGRELFAISLTSKQ